MAEPITYFPDGTRAIPRNDRVENGDLSRVMYEERTWPATTVVPQDSAPPQRAVATLQPECAACLSSGQIFMTLVDAVAGDKAVCYFDGIGRVDPDPCALQTRVSDHAAISENDGLYTPTTAQPGAPIVPYLAPLDGRGPAKDIDSFRGIPRYRAVGEPHSRGGSAADPITIHAQDPAGSNRRRRAVASDAIEQLSCRRIMVPRSSDRETLKHGSARLAVREDDNRPVPRRNGDGLASCDRRRFCAVT